MQTNSQDFVVFTGNANSALAAEIAKHLAPPWAPSMSAASPMVR